MSHYGVGHGSDVYLNTVVTQRLARPVGYDGMTDQQRLTQGRNWEIAMKRRTRLRDEAIATPRAENEPDGGETRRARQPKPRLDGNDLLEAALACFKQLYEYTMELSALPQDSEEREGRLKARDSAEF